MAHVLERCVESQVSSGVPQVLRIALEMTNMRWQIFSELYQQAAQLLLRSAPCRRLHLRLPPNCEADAAGSHVLLPAAVRPALQSVLPARTLLLQHPGSTAAGARQHSQRQR